MAHPLLQTITYMQQPPPVAHPTTMPSSSPSNEKRVVRVVKTTRTTRNGKQEEASSVVVPIVFLAFFLLLFVVYQKAPRLSNYLNRQQSSPIRVFDNVLSHETCRQLHDVAVEFKKETQGTSVLFDWPPNKTNNYIEEVLHSILQQLYNPYSDKFVVEYWVRQTWHHTIAHADMDEANFESRRELRHPYKGHVLYLTKGRNVNGPTVVFSNITKGGEMYTLSGSNQQEMLIVPFHQKRLLQFQGNLLHAVPRPVDLWLYPNNHNGVELVHAPEKDYGRSVVLFNLWKEAPTGLEYSTTSDKNSETTSGDDDTKASKSLCNRKSDWKETPIVSDWEETPFQFLSKWRQTFQLPLMGNAVRRGTRDLALQLQATSLVEEALVSSMEDVRPKRVYLTTTPSGQHAMQEL